MKCPVAQMVEWWPREAGEQNNWTFTEQNAALNLGFAPKIGSEKLVGYALELCVQKAAAASYTKCENPAEHFTIFKSID